MFIEIFCLLCMMGTITKQVKYPTLFNTVYVLWHNIGGFPLQRSLFDSLFNMFLTICRKRGDDPSNNNVVLVCAFGRVLHRLFLAVPILVRVAQFLHLPHAHLHWHDAVWVRLHRSWFRCISFLSRIKARRGTFKELGKSCWNVSTHKTKTLKSCLISVFAIKLGSRSMAWHRLWLG